MKKVVATFDELIQNYYGGSSAIELRPLNGFDDLLANYYGKPAVKAKPGVTVSAVAMSADDGEILTQPSKEKYEEYVVRRSAGGPAASEYVVERSGAMSYVSEIGGPSNAMDECGVDLLQPIRETPIPRDSAWTPAISQPTALSAPRKLPPPAAAVAQSLPVTKSTPPSKVTAEDFAADMEAILTGQKVYDPRQKKMVPRDQLNHEPASGATGAGSPTPSPDAQNQHQIFDRIAQSMQYATAYDLGTVDLQKRFGEFDTSYDLQQRAKGTRGFTTPSFTAATAPTKPDTRDFIGDLDAINHRQSRFQPAMSVSTEASVDISQPMFDTGEHVLIASDLYQDRLHVGKPPGVTFSYGQLVAMADLYGSVDEMMSTDAAKLQRVKTLIERSTEYYRTGKRDDQLDVSNTEWNDATGGRYIELAEENYEHFSPNFFFPNASFAGSLNQHGNNKSAWEACHKRAIEEAQRASLANPKTSVFLEYPLIINAFGDHFLTDAFAAGHIINKEEMTAYFKANFFNGTSLKQEGEKFFEKLAKQVFQGDVAKKFSSLETTNYPVCKWGWCLKWHPNINSASRFTDLLTTAATEQPEAVANFAVKALHDKLNKDGIEVFNQAGDKPWTITGDGYLNDKTRGIIRKAVQQSVDNINDPSILASNLDFASYFANVWKHVPQLSEASKQRVVALANDYLSPTSDRLVQAAAGILSREVNTLIQKLIRENKLQPA